MKESECASIDLHLHPLLRHPQVYFFSYLCLLFNSSSTKLSHLNPPSHPHLDSRISSHINHFMLLELQILTNISPYPLLSKLVLGLRDPRASLYEPYCLEFGCFIWFHLVVVVLMLSGCLFWVGYEVDKGFGIFMGLS